MTALHVLAWLYRHLNMFPGLMPWLDEWAEETR